jgi:ubiquinone/menaquinone biosynthesis C-methylase UbiE
VVIPVSLLRASAEHLPLADAVFEAIVMTWTLCSIPNPIAALTEMRRVLRPGGRLILIFFSGAHAREGKASKSASFARVAISLITLTH